MAELYTEIWPGERRYALIEADEVVEIRLERTLKLLPLGSIHLAKLRQHGLVDIAGTNAMIKPVPNLSEGSVLTVEVVRESIPEPGRLKMARVRQVSNVVPIQADRICIQKIPVDIDGLLDEAISGLWPITDGILSAERTRAGLIIDVDGTGDPKAINLAAAQEIARRLRLYGVGGAVMIDFIGMDSRKSRLSVAEAFDTASLTDPRTFERTAINGYGLMQMIRPRPTPSVIDTLTGTRRQQASDETSALLLLREAVCSKGAGPRQLITKSSLASLIQSWPQLISDTEQCMAAALYIVADQAVSGLGYVHVMPV